ncbi:MAG: DUF2845 domain-containing protein [Gammaproteobacteria bacterium]|jgi:hypothetical protein|nr:DUF2845 domain-containing protein [Gammaproteobacteria bacterium]HUV22863.1 DUF2845 domain-containing protein [Gammaproteobacteria bacterium]
MVNTFKVIGAALLLAISGIQPAAASGSMRCGTHIISSGQGNSPGQYEVLKRCGEPTFRQGDTWIYEKSSSVSRRIRFDNNGDILEIN